MLSTINNHRLGQKIWALAVVACLSFATGAQAQSADVQAPGTPIEKLEFQGADIRTVIYFLADYGDVNVVVAPDVKGSVTISVKNVTWKQGLEIIGRTYELAIVYEESGYIRVLPASVYRQETTDIEKHKLDKQTLTPLQTMIIRINNSTSEDVVNAVEGLLTIRGKAISDPRTNSIILRDVPDNIPEMQRFIAELDQPPRQIKISTQLLEVNSKYLLELGAELAFSTTGTSGATAISNTGATTGVTDRVADEFGRYKVGAINPDWTLDALVATIVSDGKGRIVAHPEITTIENKEARIQMGQKVPIKQFDRSGNVTTIFEEVGTILRVTPHITADDHVLMQLSPERSFAEISAAGVIISTNNASTNIIVRDGQTAVIGGLTTEDSNELEVGIPIIKDIPILGNLFKYTKKTKESRDLIILVTPTIVQQDLASNTAGSSLE